MEDLINICYELLTKYAAERAWILDCFAQTDEERHKMAIDDHDEISSYKARIQRAAQTLEENYIGLTD